ncbi:MAG: dihydrolipoamide acetyltransferase family protein [Acidimicrobiales bacterium]
MNQIAMPQLGETVTEGTITRWAKQVGDAVAVDDVLFEVSTDKVDTEVPSAYAGFVRSILVAEGETVPVGTPLLIITSTADEPVEAPAAPAAAPAAASPAAAAASPAAPVTRRVLAQEDDGGFLSPVVRALLDEHGLAPGDVVGSGRGGRITRADVLASARAPRIATATAAAPAVVGPSSVQPGPDDDIVDFTRSRRVTAEHMVRSLDTSAHTLVVVEVDYDAVDRVRRRERLSYLPFIARATLDAIAEFPHVNASVGDDRLIVHREVHLGVAVDVNFEALVVPVVKNARDLRLRSLAEAVAELAAKARNKRLTADDLSGGTFTITNVGSYGTVITSPIINQPQVAIVSTDGVRMKPVAIASDTGEWMIAVHPVGNLCLSFDHRAFDGAYASAFIARVRDTLETRDWAEEL